MKDRFQHFNSGRVNFFLLAIITVKLFGAVLKITASVVVPFTVSLLLAIVANLIVKFLAKFHIPRIVSIVLILFLMLGTFVFMGIVLYKSGQSLLKVYPKYEDRLTEIYSYIARLFDLPYDQHLSFFDNLWGQIDVRNRVRIMTLSLSNAFLVFLKDAFMVLLFMVFLLLETVFLREKLEKAFEGRVLQIRRISSDLIAQVTRYLSMKFIFSAITGIIIGFCLRIVGLEFAAVWGVIQFVVNFIPNIGSIAVGIAATAFSVIQFWPEPGPIVATGLIMLCVNLSIGSVIEPKIMGDRLGLSPLVILISLLIWGWLWGFVGLILAVPMMAIIKIVCENVPMLEPISILLGSRRAVKAARSGEDSSGEL